MLTRLRVSNSCKEKRIESPASSGAEAPMPVNLNLGVGLVNELFLNTFKAF
jgi:hypothetical protein